MLARVILSLGLLVGGTAALCQLAVAETTVDAALMKTLDPDADGTISFDEAKKAGKAVFKKLNTDSDQTLDAKELAGRVDAAELKTADPDNDGTLDWKEYKSLIKARFTAADPDKDGTLDQNELKSPAGQSLLKLIS